MKRVLVLNCLLVLSLFSSCDGILKPMPDSFKNFTVTTATGVNNLTWTTYYDTGGASNPGGTRHYETHYGTINCQIKVDKCFADDTSTGYKATQTPVTQSYSSSKTPVTHTVGMGISYTEGYSREGAYLIIDCGGQKTKVMLSQFTPTNHEYTFCAYYMPASSITSGNVYSKSGYMSVSLTIRASND